MHEKYMKLPPFQRSIKKQRRKNVNNQELLVSVAAGDMDFGFLVFLSLRVMRHLFMQLNTSTTQ